MKVANLSGAVLDWAVAKAKGYQLYKDALLNGETKYGWHVSGLSEDSNDWVSLEAYSPSTNWAQGGPIIEREAVNWYRNNKRGFPSDDRRWEAYITLNHDEVPMLRVQYRGRGATQLIAAMRCYVASKLGDDVDIPEWLS